MVSGGLVFLSFDSPPLLQVLPFGVHNSDVFAIVGKAAPDTRQNAPLAIRSFQFIDSPHYTPESG